MRFSNEELYYLRSLLPIREVLARLKIEARWCRDILRFRCPLCGGYHTAINDRTNLARCFDCRRNSNPIELVMATRRLGFVASVHFLRGIRSTQRRPPEANSSHRPAASISHILELIALRAERDR